MKRNLRYIILNLILERLVKKKKWHLAHFLIKTTNFSDGQFDWLKTHVKNCSLTTKEYRSYISPGLIASRLSSLGYDHISSKTIYSGLINLGAVVHYVTDKQTNNNVKVFEKIYHQYRLQTVEKEVLLFDEIDAEEINAPNFKGILTYGPFISLFYDYIEGVSLTRQDKMIFKYELIKKLWASRPSNKLKDYSYNEDYVGLLSDEDCINSMFEVSKSMMDCSIIEFLHVNAKKIIGEFRKLPSIIVHKDIYQPNIIKSRDEKFYLIDWDKWCVSNIGAGLLLQTDELLNPTFMNYLSTVKGSSDDHFTPVEVIRNVCIYNLTHNLHFKNYEDAIRWGYIYFNLTDCIQ
ncbi:MAG: hypothetical protein JXB49_32560 [Bacteroidales bacterium]|nr:hypothetical protein [Bacteroidales bacterium]